MPTLRLTHDQVRVLVEQAQQGAPTEICGLLAGTGQTVQRVFPMPNIASDTQHAFRIAPDALLRTLKQIETENHHLIGIYHSHPNSDTIPSQTDIRAARLNYPGVVHVIISLKGAYPRLNAWQILADGSVHGADLSISVTEDTSRADDERLSSAQQRTIILAGGLAFSLLILMSISLLPPPPAL